MNHLDHALKRGIYVAGLREEIVTCAEQVLDLMEFGECKYFLAWHNFIFYLIFYYFCVLEESYYGT